MDDTGRPRYRVAISIGHNLTDSSHPGAMANGLSEYNCSAAMLGLVALGLSERSVTCMIVGGALSERIRLINSYNVDAAVELHFNACTDKRAEGCETLCRMDYPRSKKLAEYVQETMIWGLHEVDAGVRDRGLKPGLNWNTADPDDMIAFLRDLNPPACVVEPLFLTNKRDADLLQLHGDDVYPHIAAGIVQGIVRFIETL